MNFRFVQFKRWHALRPDTHFAATTYCGLPAEGKESVETLPGGKSCGSCDKIVVRISDDHAEAIG